MEVINFVSLLCPLKKVWQKIPDQWFVKQDGAGLFVHLMQWRWSEKRPYKGSQVLGKLLSNNDGLLKHVSLEDSTIIFVIKLLCFLQNLWYWIAWHVMNVYGWWYCKGQGNIMKYVILSSRKGFPCIKDFAICQGGAPRVSQSSEGPKFGQIQIIKNLK